MPAVSEPQQRFMAICEHEPEKAHGKCPDHKVAAEFAQKPPGGYPRVSHYQTGKGWERG